MSENEFWVIYHVDKEQYFSRYYQISSHQHSVNYTNDPSEISYYNSLDDAVYEMKVSLVNENEVIIVPVTLELTPDFSRAAQKENIEEKSLLDPNPTPIEKIGSYSHKKTNFNTVTITNDDMIDFGTIVGAGSISIVPVTDEKTKVPVTDGKTIFNKLKNRFKK